jgi:DNA-binding XRE family transcriptional regulator
MDILSKNFGKITNPIQNLLHTLPQMIMIRPEGESQLLRSTSYSFVSYERPEYSGGTCMTKDEFYLARGKLGKTQKELAELLGTSIRTIHSYEQGWRNIPVHTQKQLYFLLINHRSKKHTVIPCWEKKLCENKEQCPAWEFESGHMCWYICGTLCDCTKDSCHKEKIEICKRCDIFKALLR